MAYKTKKLGPFTFKIDRPKGYVKTWNKGTDKEKSFTYPCDYGFFPGIKGEDGEGLDAFVGDDPKGRMESFLKLKPGEDGKMVPDETKFLLGVTDAEAKAIYKLYGNEVSQRRTYPSFGSVYAHLNEFKPKKKSRYKEPASTVDEIKTAAFLEACNKYGLKSAEIQKLVNGNVEAFAGGRYVSPGTRTVQPPPDTKMAPGGDESVMGQLFQSDVRS